MTNKWTKQSLNSDDKRAERSDVNGRLDRHQRNTASGGNSDQHSEHEAHGQKKGEYIPSSARFAGAPNSSPLTEGGRKSADVKTQERD